MKYSSLKCLIVLAMVLHCAVYYAVIFLLVCFPTYHVDGYGVLNSCVCGEQRAAPMNRYIVGGTIAAPYEFPWMALVLYTGRTIGGGAIINDRYILTAAHVIIRFQIQTVHIAVGVHDRITLSGALVYGVAQLIAHEYYSETTYNNDIGLIKVQGKFRFSSKVSPICLPFGEEVQGTNKVTIAGWGHTGYKKSPSRSLRKAELNLMSDYHCKRSSTVRISKGRLRNILCAIANNEDACQGDSGTPLMQQFSSRKWYAIGIVSFGYKCGIPGWPGVYTNVSSFDSWITTHTDDANYCDKEEK